MTEILLNDTNAVPPSIIFNTNSFNSAVATAVPPPVPQVFNQQHAFFATNTGMRLLPINANTPLPFADTVFNNIPDLTMAPSSPPTGNIFTIPQGTYDVRFEVAPTAATEFVVSVGPTLQTAVPDSKSVVFAMGGATVSGSYVLKVENEPQIFMVLTTKTFNIKPISMNFQHMYITRIIFIKLN